MNPDDSAPLSGSGTPSSGTPQAEPTSGQQPVRRAGFLGGAGAQAAAAAADAADKVPAAGSATLPGSAGAHTPGRSASPLSGHATAPTAAQNVPQRSAFRPTVGAESGAAVPSAATSATAGASALTAPASAAPAAGTPHRTATHPFGGKSAERTAPSGAAGAAPLAGATAVATAGAAATPASAPGKHQELARVDGKAVAQPSSGPRKARVLLSRIDPLSAVKIGFLLSIAAGIMLVVAVHVLWQVLASMGFFVLVQEWVSRLFTEGDQGQELNILQFVEYSKIMSATVLIAVVNVVLLTGLAAVWALLYNFISRVVGGIYVTLTDD